MFEIPEALTVACQINNTAAGKHIANVITAQSPHKFTWYYGDPQNYSTLLEGKAIEKANACGGMVEIIAENVVILTCDGAGLKYHKPGESRPKRHQLLIEFDDSSAISVSVQMYGGIWCFEQGKFDNPYYLASKEKPSPLYDSFDKAYFHTILSASNLQKLTAKAFLATEQRIPGLGNGVLQDILWKAKIHPKRKMSTLANDDIERIYITIKSVLKEMAELGGRNTEKDLFGNYGGYDTLASKYKSGFPCLECGGAIKKENYMGGSIYYCESCQIV